jgi:hypothetical protein
MLRRARALFVLVVVSAALSSVASGAAVFSTDVQYSPDPANSWTPSYVVSTTDLINGTAPATSTGNFALEVGGGLPVLTDGAYGTITRVPVTGTPEPHPAFATAGNANGAGSLATYNLNLLASPLGYNISQIDVYGGWNDAGRDQQRYNVLYATVANPATFIPLTSVDYQPANPTNVQSATRVRITEDALSNLATGVAAIRFDFTPAVENGHTGYAEIDIIGTPVPEPTTAGLLALASLGLLSRRRRS